MYCKIQLVMCTDDGREDTVTDVLSLTKDCQRIEPLGLALAEAKQLLTLIQQHLLAQQSDAVLAAHVIRHLHALQSASLPLPLPAS